MSGALLAIRVGLAVVLAMAGVGKLADRAGTRQAVVEFGVPEPLVGVVAGLLPLMELAAAVLLIFSPTSLVGAAVALLLLLTFSAAIARSIARGEAPDCHCFGAIHSEPAGPRTLIRNLVLAALAALVVVDGSGTSATAWLGTLGAAWLLALVLGVTLAAAVFGGVWFALRLLRRNGELLLRVDALEEALETGGVAVPSAADVAPTAGLAVGTVAPEFSVPDVVGGQVTLGSLRAALGSDLMLVFSDPGCGPCSALMPTVAAWQRSRPGGLRTVVMSRGGRAANRDYASEHGLETVLIQRDREVSERFGADATPSAVVVASDGTIASPVHTGEEEIRALVAARSSELLLPLQRVQPAARRAPLLRTLRGQPTKLTAYLNDAEPTMLVFWNPDCGFCDQMLGQLRELDAARASGIVVISTGDPTDNRALGLRAPILLEDGFATGNRLEVAGTPSAVFVDGRGRPLSDVAVGAEAVLALALAPASADGAPVAA